MPRLLLSLTLALAVSGWAPRTSAHHALESYDTSNEVESAAVLAKVDWINPHAWMRFDIRQADGRVDKNALLETLSLSGLRGLGIDRDALTVGSEYRITYYPNRNGSPGGFMTKLTRPTGDLVGKPEYVPELPCSGPCDVQW